MYKELRQLMIRKRKSLSKIEIEERSRIISETIFASNAYNEAESIFIYINFGEEVSTFDIIERAWRDGKKVAVPVSMGNRDMYFVEIKDFSNMKRKKIGTLEPEIGREKEFIPNEKSLFIVPGSVFDKKGNRWGYGGGYYDTYISKYNIKNTIGVCYDFQLVERLETEPHDKKMKYVITEKRMIGGDRK